MRKIKFRGQRIRTKEWLHGNYLNMKGKTFINGVTFSDREANPNASYSDYEVIPKSVGEYTGLEDKQGKEIYEGDILKGYKEFDGKNFVVKWERNMSHHSTGYTYGFYFPSKLLFENKEYEVIGNIYDDPDKM